MRIFRAVPFIASAVERAGQNEPIDSDLRVLEHSEKTTQKPLILKVMI